MNYELTGTVIKIGDIETYGQNGFSKRTIVIDDGAENYPQQIAVEFSGKKVNEPNARGVQVGDKVTVKFNVRGREWNGRYFVNLDGWFIARQGVRPQSEQVDETQRQLAEQADDPLDEDVPF